MHAPLFLCKAVIGICLNRIKLCSGAKPQPRSCQWRRRREAANLRLEAALKIEGDRKIQRTRFKLISLLYWWWRDTECSCNAGNQEECSVLREHEGTSYKRKSRVLNWGFEKRGQRLTAVLLIAPVEAVGQSVTLPPTRDTLPISTHKVPRNVALCGEVIAWQQLALWLMDGREEEEKK